MENIKEVNKSNNFLKISISAAILITSISIGAFLLIYIPTANNDIQNKRDEEIRQVQLDADSKLQKLQQEQTQQKVAETERNQKIDSCINTGYDEIYSRIEKSSVCKNSCNQITFNTLQELIKTQKEEVKETCNRQY